MAVRSGERRTPEKTNPLSSPNEREKVSWQYTTSIHTGGVGGVVSVFLRRGAGRDRGGGGAQDNNIKKTGEIVISKPMSDEHTRCRLRAISRDELALLRGFYSCRQSSQRCTLVLFFVNNEKNRKTCRNEDNFSERFSVGRRGFACGFKLRVRHPAQHKI